MEARRGKRRLSSEINVVPYIDVMLVLLVIFMITAPLLTQGIEVELPKTQASPITAEKEPVTLYVDAGGRLYLDIGESRQQPLDDEGVLKRVRAVMNNNPQELVLISADKRVPYDHVAHGMSLLQAAGVTKIGFKTEPLDTRKDRAR
jgi:biopolymer transport protein TolR